MTTLVDRIAELMWAEQEMSHEPIILDPDEWPKSYPLVQYNLNRLVQNAHDERNRLQAKFSELECDLGERVKELEVGIDRRRTQVDERREADLRRTDERIEALVSRHASLETRVVVYGTVAGFVAGGGMTALLMYLFRGH